MSYQILSFWVKLKMNDSDFKIKSIGISDRTTKNKNMQNSIDQDDYFYHQINKDALQVCSR